jgi:hypothetical protein
MGLISCVTSLTPDMVAVQSAGDDIRIVVDTLAMYLKGDTRDEQLRNLADVAHKLLNAHDAIAAQERLFPAEVQR